jgi:tRNA threonylcarbamoyl adenosine modification protein YjeE
MRRISPTPEDTFDLGRELGASLKPGDVVLLYGGLGAGKTLLTKGILDALDYDVDEVTSPSFALVNLYKTEKFDVYHIDLWRVGEGQDAASAVGLDEILETGESVTIVEWAERLGDKKLPGRMIKVTLKGDGDEPRSITVEQDKETKIVIRKSDRKLELHSGTDVKSYDIVLGSSPQGQKSREGDGRTPEGEFYVFAKNPKSGHHLSLAISYPDVDAAERGSLNGTIDRAQRDEIVRDIEQRGWIPQETPLGGRIYIHGGGTASDWTDGCIALSDEDMTQIFERAQVGTRVTILP